MPVEIREIVLRAEIIDPALDSPGAQATRQVDLQALRDELIRDVEDIIAAEFRKREGR